MRHRIVPKSSTTYLATPGYCSRSRVTSHIKCDMSRDCDSNCGQCGYRKRASWKTRSVCNREEALRYIIVINAELKQIVHGTYQAGHTGRPQGERVDSRKKPRTVDLACTKPLTLPVCTRVPWNRRRICKLLAASAGFSSSLEPRLKTTLRRALRIRPFRNERIALICSR